MNLKNCPNQYQRIIRKFTTGFSENRPYLEQDALEYLEELNKSRRLSQENHRLHAAALKWFYLNILGIKLQLKVPYRKRGLPDTLTFDEVEQLLKELPARYLLLFQFMYGLGMKIGEVVKLRIKDVDLNNGKIFLSKGREYKIPMYLYDQVRAHFKKRQKRYVQDRQEKNCFIPKDGRGYSSDFADQPFFASRKRTTLKKYPLTGRQFIDPSTLHVYISQAQHKVKFYKRTTCMTLRHSFALYQLQNECNDVVLKEYLGHSDIRQTLNYKKLLRQTFFTPLDFTGKTVPVKQIKELVYMQRYPSEEGLCKFIEEAKECKDSKIKIAENHSQWLQWLSKAKEKNLDCSESSSENFTGCKDYIFLDLRKLSEHRPRKKIRIIQALLAVSKKKLLICPEE